MIKPPLGLTPRSVHDSERARHIIEALLRYAGLEDNVTIIYTRPFKQIPREWIEELLELSETVGD